jgi:hypothetical protein
MYNRENTFLNLKKIIGGQCCGSVGSETVNRIQTRKKSFRIQAVLNPKTTPKN